MLDKSITTEEKLEKYNKKLYKGRFGISYHSISTKILSMHSFEIRPKKGPKKKKLQKGLSMNLSNIFKKNYLEEKTKPHQNINIIPEVNEIELDRIYNNNNKEYEKNSPIYNFLKIKKCSILKYGVKKSTENIKYSYCKTCDHNLLNPICFPCINSCHKGHLIKYIYNKGKIKCSCGEKNHYQKNIYNINNNKNIICLCNEWNIVAKLGFYYINHNQKPICILCHNYCEHDNKKDKIIKIEKNKNIPMCTCTNLEIHKSHKLICEKIIDSIKDYNEFNLLLHPIQFINMIFKSKNNFKLIFEDFEIFMDNLNNSEKQSSKEYFSKFYTVDITNTNIYRTLLIFQKIIHKKDKNYIFIYNQEVINYFSFDIIKKLFSFLENAPSSEEKSFRILLNKYLFLFNKFYINYKTKSLNKFKLNDLKNISFFQKLIIFDKNKTDFTEASEIISFLLKILLHIIFNKVPSIESMQCIKEILSILRKFSCYNLINNEQMIRICLNLLKIFNYIRILKNNSNNGNNNKSDSDIKHIIDIKNINKIILKLFYIIMKMIMNFIYNYNDNVLNKILFDKEKYPEINSISFDNVCFIYKKNELGKFIYQINIYILAYIEKYFINVENKKVILIKRIGMELLQYSLNKDDDYILNIINCFGQIQYYFLNNSRIIINNSQYYKELLRQCNLISDAFLQYFNFEMTIEKMLEVVNNSLNYILGESTEKVNYLNDNDIQERFNQNQIIAFLSTNYFTLISKVIGIIHLYQNRKNVLNNNKKSNNIKLNLFIQSLSLNIEDEIIKKIIYFYFCFVYNSPDNSLLIFTHSIFNELTKVPIKYSQLIFKLFYICIKNILSLNNNEDNFKEKQKNIISAKTNTIKRLYHYLEEIIEEKNNNSNNLINSLYYFLQILELAVFDYYYFLSNNIFLYKVQNILINLDKKYNLVNQFFDIKDNELILQNKNIKNYSDKIAQNDKVSSSITSLKNLNENNGAKEYEFFEKSILLKCFVIYIKLINNCFYFSIETDRKKIEDLINIDKIIFALQNYKINLDLRTEFLRFLRKIFLDIKYSCSENNLYTKIIINNQDKLKEIKNNPLINNLEYPTKLLIFINEFYNIEAKGSIKEKIKYLYEKKIVLLKKLKTQSQINLLYKKNRLKNTSFLNFHNLKKNKMNLGLNNKDIKDDIQNDIKDDIEEEKNILSQNNNEEQESSEEDQNDKPINGAINNLIKFTNDNNINDIIIEESRIINNESEEENTSSKIKNCDKDENNNDKINNSQKLINKVEKTERIENNNKVDRRVSCYIPKSFGKNDLFGNKALPNNIIFPSNKRRNVFFNDEEDGIDNKNLEKLNDLMNNNNEGFYEKCKNMNLLEDAFNERFFNILNYELDNIKRNIENIKLNSPDKIEYVRNYIENGLLID